MRSIGSARASAPLALSSHEAKGERPESETAGAWAKAARLSRPCGDRAAEQRELLVGAYP